MKALPLARRALAALSLALLAGGCDGSDPDGGPGPAPSTAAPRRTVEITVAGTSDLHGRLSTLPLLGGNLAELRAKNPAGVVLVDAGDMFQGTLESNTNEGAAVIEAYKALKYDAVAIGNHELDYGPVGEMSTPPRTPKEGPEGDPRGALKARAAQAKGAFPMLAANILEDGHLLAWPNVAPSVMVVKNGIQVGIIGVSTMETPATTIAANVRGITMKPIAEAVAAEARALREKGAKIIVVAAHAGGQCKKLDAPADLSSCDGDAEIFQMARAVPPGLVQVIVAGHTHQAVAHEVNGIQIVQSNAYGTHFGRVDLVVDAATGKVESSRIHPPIPVGTLVPAPAVKAAVAPAIEGARALRARRLGATLAEPFTSRYRDESAVGNLVTTLLLEAEPKADIAVMNGGGLRADLPAGEVTYGAFYDVLPFDNRVARLTMTGRALRATVRRNLTSKSGILSLAGARVAGACKGGELDVQIFVAGQKKAERPLRDDDRVRVVTNEFLATRGDDFGPGDQVEIDEDGPAIRDVIAKALEKRGGALRPTDWLVPGKPRIALPGPVGADVCKGK